MILEAAVFAAIGIVVAMMMYMLYFRDGRGSITSTGFSVPVVKPSFGKTRVEYKAPKVTIEEPEEKKRAPISGKCEKCGEKGSLPFRCKYCGELYCEEHRLPENHDCGIV